MPARSIDMEASRSTAPPAGLDFAESIGTTTPSGFSRALSGAVKRLFDVTAAVVLLLAISPVMVLIALAVMSTSRGPVLFRQRRLGRDMHEFTLLKFRTMHQGASSLPHEEFLARVSRGEIPADQTVKKLLDDPRVTTVGAFLRRTSLDELPQLLNVLLGDMSLVGPRPAIGYELNLYEPQHFERFSVAPGMTGLWQVSGRSRVGFIQMLDLDVEYARHGGLRRDASILLRTPAVLFKTV